MIEILLVIIGSLVILILYFRNRYVSGHDFAAARSREHFMLLRIVAETFVDVMIKGKGEKEIIDD